MGAPSVAERPEKQLIQAFVDKIEELRPQLVTFNGCAFDLPVLRYRAMIHGISAPGLASRAYYTALRRMRAIFVMFCRRTVQVQKRSLTKLAD